MKKYLTIALLVLASKCLAQTDPTRSFSLIFEEDFFWEFFNPAKNLDKDYTGGGILLFRQPFVQKWHLATPNRIIDKWTPMGRLEKDYRDNFFETYRVGLTVFTPEGKYLNISTPLQGQRPYASFVFMGTTRNFLNARKGKSITTQFDVGVIGTYAGREMQASIHKVYKRLNNIPDTARPYDPQGWQHQISAGGEPSFLYTVMFKKLIAAEGCNGHFSQAHLLDVFTTYGASVGLNNAISASATVRLGLIRSQWHQFNSYPVNEALDTIIPAEKGFLRNTELYIFASLRPSLMIYNVPLQGQFKHSEVSFKPTEVEHFLGQVETGVTLSFLRIITATGIFIYRTKQYNTPFGKEHSYFSVGLSVRSPFNR